MSSPQAPPALPPPFWFAFEAFPAVTWGWFGALPLLMAEMTTPDDCTSPSPDAPEYRAEMKRKIITCSTNLPLLLLLLHLKYKQCFLCKCYLISITTRVIMSTVDRFTIQSHLLLFLHHLITIAIYCVRDRLVTTWTSDDWRFIRCTSFLVLLLMDTSDTTDSTAILANQNLTIGIVKDIQKVLHFHLTTRKSPLILMRICIINGKRDPRRW